MYPVFESLDISSVLRLRPQPLREAKFVLDVHLGRLAAFLRILGFDALYENSADDSDLAGARNPAGTLLGSARGPRTIA